MILNKKLQTEMVHAYMEEVRENERPRSEAFGLVKERILGEADDQIREASEALQSDFDKVLEYASQLVENEADEELEEEGY